MKVYKIRLIVLFIVILLPAITSAAPLVHPYMLFHDISETPGYQNQAVDPWKTMQNYYIIPDANIYLTYNFAGTIDGYDRIMYRGNFARDLGLAYQITKKPQYAQKAREALLNMD